MTVDEVILLHDPNGEAIEMDEPIDDGLLPEHHESEEEHHDFEEESTEDEYETEENDEEEFEEEIDTDYQKKLLIFAATLIRTSFLLVASTVISFLNIEDMARGRGRGSMGRVSKSSTRGRGNMPTVPVPTISSQQGGTHSSGGQDQVETCPTTTPPIQTSGHGSTPSISKSFPIMPNDSNVIGEGTSTQRNAIGEGSSAQSDAIGEGENNSNVKQTLIFLSPSGLKPSRLCSEMIPEIFKNEVEPNGVNWKSVS
ncbi:uncharacterized protein LOC132053685 [Lycium ferocissimum]|uniref:uncharacterized protein LOC132053685 n=1 Tax=Lycium ferocissimum TaxID=112874 RepID=UPI0028153116|nr:uncharacterized protein LOC132053685 [Lycium ferocissimum]